MVQSVIITGSSGFLGRNLSSRLFEIEQTELIQINRENGYDLSMGGWTNTIPSSHVDVVYHLAQSNRYRDFPEGAEDVFRVNIASTFELLEWSRLHGVKRFIFASTGNVYKNSNEKLTEESACDPDTLYAASKFSAEKLVESYSDFFEVVNTRIFGLYGPGQKNNIISNIIKCMDVGNEITLDGIKGLSLTPLFIDDAENAFVKLSHMPLQDTKSIINLAGDEVLNLFDIANSISGIIQKKPVFTVTTKAPKLFCGDNKKMKNLTGLNNLVSFKEGLKKTLM
jgi:UDP-glucose 4-epimerase